MVFNGLNFRGRFLSEGPVPRGTPRATLGVGGPPRAGLRVRAKSAVSHGKKGQGHFGCHGPLWDRNRAKNGPTGHFGP